MVDKTIVRDFKSFTKELLILKNQNMFCDAAFVINGERIPVHAVVLASSSEYLKKLLTESTSKELVFENTDKEVILSLLEYCYTGKLKINKKNVSNILKTAYDLSIMTVFEKSLKGLKKLLDFSNCLSIWKIVRLGNSQNLKDAVSNFIRRNFETTQRSEEFLNLDHREICELIESNVYTSSDVILYKAIKKWLNHDRESREMNLADVLSFVKLNRFPEEFLISESLLLSPSNERCSRMFLEALKSHKENDSTNCTLIAVGGRSLERSRVIEIFDVINLNWVEVENAECSKTRFASLLLDDKLILIGGKSNDIALNNVESYDLKSGQTEILPPMKHARFWLPVVKYKQYIFAIGGKDGNHATPYVEKYDTESRIWTEVTPLRTPRYTCGAVVLGDEIFVVGGYGHHVYFNSTVAYNVSSNQWRNCAPMNKTREAFGLVVNGEYIYAVGGWDGFSTAERYDPVNDNWTMIQSIEFGKIALSATNFMGNVVIAGGHRKDAEVSTVQVYNEESDTWKTMVSLKNPRDQFSLLEVPWCNAKLALSRINL